MEYIGEFLLPRQLGHFAIVLNFSAAALAMVAYFFSTQKALKTDNFEEKQTAQWRSIGRWAFGIHGISVFTVIGCIFYVMITKRYEYFYAHSHTDDDLAFQYVFAAFWEGQEGSFLLWMFWHVILGIWLIWRGQKEWEAPVLAVLASVQFFLGAMILGLHFGFGDSFIKWGSNPILLLRETNNAPIFQQADYLEKIRASAKGLNPLLQNYWMTIHPPTLFLGFASTTIPFCFAIAGLWRKKYTEWLPIVFPYALFSAAILGLGILMGGAWAYEALSFNGYWAWDPVENMSLVPWIVLIAGVHTHLVARATGHSIRATALFYMLSFLLVLYSTFLTRSGILGDTSAHAFTEMGLENQLVLFQLFFVGLAAYFFVKNYKKVPVPPKEEMISSREFWLFMGSLVLVMSAVLISFTTSIPVFNKMAELAGNAFGFKTLHWTAPIEPVAHYNKTQLWIGVFIGLLSAITQFLRYKESNFAAFQSKFWKHMGISALPSIVLTALVLSTLDAKPWQYALLLFSGIFTFASNANFLFVFFRKNLKAAGSSFSHMGFGLLIVGIMWSGVNKRWISNNRFAMESLINFDEEQLKKNILLMKGIPIFMNGYLVTYESDTASGNRRDFTVKMVKKDASLTKDVDSFTVHPYVLYNKKTAKIASTNPDTRHFLGYDIFSHIAALPPGEQDPEIAKQEEDSLQYVSYTVSETTVLKPQNLKKETPKYSVYFEGLDLKPQHAKYKPEEKDLAVGIRLRFKRDSVSRFNPNGATEFTAMPMVLLRENFIYQLPATVNDLGVRVRIGGDIFDKLFGASRKLDFKEYVFTQGQSLQLGNKTITFEGIDANPQPEGFKLEAGDLAFAAKMRLQTQGSEGSTLVKPIYIVRGANPVPLPDRAEGMTFVVAKVNPETRQIHVQIADNSSAKTNYPIDIAESAPRTDYLVLESTINPGINLVWLGCLLMLFGLTIAMFFRLKK
jgi:cytochrome c-type biogenesis protein CcmF